MADEKQQGAQTVRMVKCAKLGRELPGLDRPPWKGEIGKRVYENVSKDAWKMWVEHSKMLMNEYRLNPLDPNSQKIMEQQLEQFFDRAIYCATVGCKLEIADEVLRHAPSASWDA